MKNIIPHKKIKPKHSSFFSPQNNILKQKLFYFSSCVYLLKTFLKQNAPLPGIKLAQVQYGVFGLGQTYEQVDTHDQSRRQRTLGHNLNKKRRPRRQQIDHIQEARPVRGLVRRLDLKKLD